MTRAEALAEAVDIILANVGNVAQLLDRLDQAGGNAKLIAAIRARLVAPLPLVCCGLVKPDRDLWDEACAEVLSEPRFSGEPDIPDNVREALYGADERGLLPSHWDAVLDTVEKWERWIYGPPLSSHGRVLAFALQALPDAERRRVIERIIQIRA
jgi:hypothetical protein